MMVSEKSHLLSLLPDFIFLFDEKHTFFLTYRMSSMDME